MRVIVAGSRTLTDAALVERAIRESGFEISELLSGHAKGTDQLAELWARNQTPPVPVRLFLAAWATLGAAAGPTRNRAMAEEAEALICLWDGLSPGTRNMILQAKRKGLPTFVYRTDRA